jgi:replicative DNA helicase
MRPELATILATALNMHADGVPVNAITLKQRLDGIVFDEHSATETLRGLSFAGTLPNIHHVCWSLRRLSLKRKLADYLTNLSVQAVEHPKFGAVAADAVTWLNDYLAEINGEQKSAPHLHEAGADFIARLEKGKDPVEIPTGLAALDEATGGHHRGEVTLLAGRPSMGKSMIALASMLRTAKKGHGVLFFSMEMTMDQLVARALADFAYTTPLIAYFDLKPGKVVPHQIRRLKEANELFKGMPIEIDTRNGLTIDDMMAKARATDEKFRQQYNTGLALVCADHLLKIKPSARYAGKEVQELGEISNGCSIIAKTLHVAFLGLHQLNRDVERRDNQRPVLSDLRGSGSLEQDADVVLFAYRPGYQFERRTEGSDEETKQAQAIYESLKHRLEIQIAKQRNGPTKTLEFWIDMAANVVRDVDKRADHVR